MAKSKNSTKPFDVPVKTAQRQAAGKPATATPKVESHAVRETIESIVIAFVLAFLFRTFEAEAFVIPTGSMAPTLMGRHKDVECPKCGYRYEVSASEEESEDGRRPTSDCIAGMCPICHYVMPMRPNLPGGGVADAKVPIQPSYNGDRILVNKYLYTFTDPKRWDVVVFKFPGDAKVNYIKRLVGLPGETLRIEQGDIFIKPPGDADKAEFAIERKPPNKVLAMRQVVHDTNHDPAELDAAGWPLRWNSPPGDAGKWQLEKSVEAEVVRQKYSVDSDDGKTSWLRYENLVPTYEVWQQVEAAQSGGANQKPFANTDRAKWRRLIMDSNPYNGRITTATFHQNLQVDPSKMGLHWVGDLMVEANLDVSSPGGEIILDLVEAGKHFSCTIDVKTGEARLAAANVADYAPKAKTSIIGPGKHRIAFANFDDQLLLWVDGSLVSFDGGTGYDATKVFGDRSTIQPQTSDSDLGDLAPVGIGARDAKLTVDRMQVWRDLYYIADRDDRNRGMDLVTDFNHPANSRPELIDLATKPNLWGHFAERNHVEFPIADTQLFVMGDNSAESSDARLWFNGDGRGSRPGGAYLDKRLLIGKALCVYWPHSWNRIPGTPIPFPLFPNVADMRLVR
jgi:signal peptidase I